MKLSNKSLAVKYRPKTLSEVCAQEEVVEIIANQLRNKTFRNTILLTGPAGCGKTTIGRILAYDINGGKGIPIEMDCATHNSVDDIRDIIIKAQQKALDAEYKEFILDECFAPNTLISMADGVKQIKDVKVGDYIQNAVGYGKVTQVHTTKVLTNRLCCVKINGVETFTTIDHLYFTNNGWVSAKDLQQGDIVYANIQMQKLWERVLQETDRPCLRVLLESMQSGIPSQDISTESEALDEALRDMWERIFRDWERTEHEDMLKRMQSETDTTKLYNVFKYRNRYSKSAEKFVTNETKQSELQPSSTSQNKSDKNQTRSLECMDRGTWWQRALYRAAITALSKLTYDTDFRICYSNENATGQRLPDLLQSRPRLSRNEACNRGGWQVAPLEKWIIERCQKNKFLEQFRVDSVEIYQRGNNDRLFESCFDSEQLDSGELYLYDLTVDTHPSYFANGILVHNCHMISTAGWNALLKILEEPPKNTIFIFCTTDPQKIPATILSRIQRFELKRIPFNVIVARIKYIIGCENTEGAEISYEDTAIHYIAKLADGGMRDALTQLDKVIAYSKNITMESVVKALGVTDYKVYFDITNNIIDCNENKVIEIIESEYRSGADLKQFIKQYTLFLLDVCKYQLFNNFEYIQIPDSYEQELKDITTSVDKQFLKFLLDNINKLSSDIKWETQVKAIIELSLLKLSRDD